MARAHRAEALVAVQREILEAAQWLHYEGCPLYRTSVRLRVVGQEEVCTCDAYGVWAMIQQCLADPTGQAASEKWQAMVEALAFAEAWDATLSHFCDGPERSAFRAALAQVRGAHGS